MKLHYYLISFQSETSVGSARLGFPDQFINNPRIAEAKEVSGMPSSSVPIAISYMGYMTQAEVRGEPDHEMVV